MKEQEGFVIQYPLGEYECTENHRGRTNNLFEADVFEDLDSAQSAKELIEDYYNTAVKIIPICRTIQIIK